MRDYEGSLYDKINTFPNLIRQLCLSTTRKIGISSRSYLLHIPLPVIRHTEHLLEPLFIHLDVDGSQSPLPCGQFSRNRHSRGPLSSHEMVPCTTTHCQCKTVTKRRTMIREIPGLGLVGCRASITPHRTTAIQELVLSWPAVSLIKKSGSQWEVEWWWRADKHGSVDEGKRPSATQNTLTHSRQAMQKSLRRLSSPGQTM